MFRFLEGGEAPSLPLDQYHARGETQRTFFTVRTPSGELCSGGSLGRAHQAACHSPVTPTAPARGSPGQPHRPWARPSSNLRSTPGGRTGLTCRAHPSGRLSGVHSARDRPVPSWSRISMKSKGDSKQSSRLKSKQEPGPPEPGEESWQGHPFSHQVVHLI